MLEPIQDVFTRFWSKFTDYLPGFFAGFLIFSIGLVLAGLLKKIFLTLLTFIKLERILEKTKLITRAEVNLWEQILAEILKWTIIILFLIPTLEVWGLSQATAVLNQFLFYIPNVIVSVIIGLIGLILANLASQLVNHSINTLDQTSAKTLAMFSKSAIVFFTILIILSQLGVAQDLIKILFTGIIAMLALAGGLAFGLGGKDLARELLTQIRSKLNK